MALLIGITYQSSPSEPHGFLPACKEDITLMKNALESVGFVVTCHQDVELDTMKDLIEMFVKALKEDDDVLVYFSGHGCTIDGYQFLIPAKMCQKLQKHEVANDSKLFREKCYNIIHVHNLLIDKVKDAHKVMILDCCRTRLFDRTMSKGNYEDTIQWYPEAQKKATNMVYLYATNDHNEAGACTTESLFTKKLVPLIKENKNIPEILEKLNEASKNDNWKQKPMVEGTSLSFRF